MKKPLVAVLALGLLGAALVAPAHAGDKASPRASRPVRVQQDQTFYLVNAGLGSSGCASEGMLLMLAPRGEGKTCQNAFVGAPTTAFVAASGSYCLPEVGGLQYCGHTHHEAAEGLPLTLDATRKITGTIVVGSNGHPDIASTGAGPTTFHIDARGTVGGTEISLGSFAVDYTTTPDQSDYEVPFEIELPADLDKARLTAFGIDLWNTGATILHGSYKVDESTVVVPVWSYAARP